MKTRIFCFILFLFFVSCSTSKQTTGELFKDALVGQNEFKIFSILGPPNKVIPQPDGKLLIYEHTSNGMFLTPNKSSITYNAKPDALGNRGGITFRSGVNTTTNKPEYVLYQKEISSLKVFLDSTGTCVRYEQDLPREVIHVYNERFKHFYSNNP